MAPRPDTAPSFRTPISGPVRAPDPDVPARSDVPRPHAGFLTGRRGPRTATLLLTTGAIGSALAALLLASGVLTPVDSRGPVGPVAPLPHTSPALSPPSSPSPSWAPEPSATASSISGAPARTTAPASSRPASAPSSGPSPSEASGVLRPGDSGPAVAELQRLLRTVPHMYPDGPVTGHYDDELARAVARFQEWYGVRGDEEGVYGDDTRRRLEEVT